MAAQFFSGNVELDTTGSGQTMLRCPAGKTLLLKTMYIKNADSSSTDVYIALEDNSITSTSYVIDGVTLASNVTYYSTVPRVLEENDEILVQTSQANQHVHISYVLFDQGTYSRYRGGTKSITTEDQNANIITCPTGSTLLVSLIQFYNASQSNSTNNIVRITDSSGSITNDIDQGNLNSGATATYQSSIVLESGDSLSIYNTEQPFTVTTTYLEIRNPAIRGQ